MPRKAVPYTTHQKALDKIKILEESLEDLNTQLAIANGVNITSRNLENKSKEIKLRLPLALWVATEERAKLLMMANNTEYLRYCVRLELGFTHQKRDTI